MPMSNAERQQKHRERIQSDLENAKESLERVESELEQLKERSDELTDILSYVTKVVDMQKENDSITDKKCMNQIRSLIEEYKQV